MEHRASSHDNTLLELTGMVLLNPDDGPDPDGYRLIRHQQICTSDTAQAKIKPMRIPPKY
jgi:hypothetical protein